MTQRTDQVGDLLRAEIGQFLLREIEAPKDCLITVTAVKVTPDLRSAKVFVSVLPEQKTGSALDILRRHTREIQKYLNGKLTMKFVPRIEWEVDLTALRYAQIEEALKK